MREGVPAALTLPRSSSDARLVITAADGAPALLFYADGSSTGGSVSLGGRRLFDIDWLTGTVRDAA